MTRELIKSILVLEMLEGNRGVFNTKRGGEMRKIISRNIMVITVLICNFFISSLIFAGMNWTQATNSAGWSARVSQTSVVFDYKMWAFGGMGELGNYNDVWYSTDGASWTQATSLAGWSKRNGHTSVVFDNKMWVIGGVDYTYRNDTWYSIDGISWTQATDSAEWSGRSYPALVVFDNKIWVLGGMNDSGSYDDVWYSTDGISWTQATDSAGWSKRYLYTSVVFDNKMWVIGGMNDSVVYNDVWYSTDGISWTQATALAGWAARTAHTSVVFDNKMWVLGGRNGIGFYNDVWYSTDGVNWTQATDSAGWVGRGLHTSVIFDNKMWVIGGLYLDAYNDVWSSTGLGVEEKSNPAKAGSKIDISPNPFIERTSIYYNIPSKTQVLITIHDITGRVIKTLVNEEGKEAGSYNVEFSKSDVGRGKLSSGVYFVSLKAGNRLDSKRLILVK